VLTCSGGVATSEGTLQLKNAGYRGLAVFSVTHGCTCCVLPTLNTAVTRLSSWPAMYPHRREMKQVKLLTRFCTAAIYQYQEKPSPCDATGLMDVGSTSSTMVWFFLECRDTECENCFCAVVWLGIEPCVSHVCRAALRASRCVARCGLRFTFTYKYTAKS
jgi:hypothetical protein